MSPDGQGRPVLLFIMGMARSGTSAITRVISLCGGVLPAALAGANPANPRGYWEPRKAIILNERILHRNGSSRFDTTLRLQEPDAFGAVEKTACIADIQALPGDTATGSPGGYQGSQNKPTVRYVV